MININLKNFFLYHFRLAFLLARQDIVSRFRRSKLGPIWVSLGTFIHMAVLGLVFSYLLLALSIYRSVLIGLWPGEGFGVSSVLSF